VGPEAQYRGLSLSHDGKRVAAHRHETEGGDIWVTDLRDNRTTAAHVLMANTGEFRRRSGRRDDSRIA
jgi:hypothetical protein